jgi:acetoin utilization deacetylase AcuC-like enzyme
MRRIRPHPPNRTTKSDATSPEASPLRACYVSRMAHTSSERIAIVDDPRFDAHRERSGGHPERPERLVAAREGLYAALPEHDRVLLEAREAALDELARVHDADYLRSLRERLREGYGHIDADTYYSPGTAEAALRSAGGAAALATALLSDAPNAARRGVALLRPPGHHAEPDAAMGFCMLNNVAVAASAALDAGALRAAIVDWDVHHGNGTQSAFYADPRVLFVSLHQHPFYPGTGRPDEIGQGPGRGYTANVALPSGQGPETYAHAFRRVVLPLLGRFEPDLVLVSAGFDAHRRDPLAQMHLDAASYGAMASALVEQAQPRGGRVGLLLEGGYDLIALQESVAAATRALRGERTALPEDAPSTAGREAVELARRALEPYWNLDDVA